MNYKHFMKRKWKACFLIKIFLLRLQIERLYEWGILENHDNRKN